MGWGRGPRVWVEQRWWLGGGEGRNGDPAPESDSGSGGRQGHRENEEGCRAGEARRGASGESLRQTDRVKRWEGIGQQEEENAGLI